MRTLNRDTAGAIAGAACEARHPVKVLQIGEGNFLRAFVDWMLHVSRSKGWFDGAVAVVQPRPSGRAKIEQLAAQDGLFTVVTRGLEDGRPVERREIVTVVAEAFDPYSEWERFLAFARSPELRFIVSNTTEAGLRYEPEPPGDGPVLSFPGKVARLLHERWRAFGGDPARGLVLLPCELTERNGEALREAVLKHAADWGWPEAFREWVERHNRFLNTLVDRIVTGYPEAELAEKWFAEWGYRDAMLTTAEPYHLWAIEGPEELDDELGLRKAGLNVHYTRDLAFFRERKVRILNGAHTWMAPIGLLHGVQTVREALEHPALGPAVREAVYGEILPAMDGAGDDLAAYADSVFERFANPYIRHRLSDIAMNSLSKFRVRLLPTLVRYAERGKRIPPRLAEGLAGLLRYCRVRPDGSGGYVTRALDGTAIPVRDDAELLAVMAEHWRTAEDGADAGDARMHRAVRAILADGRLWGRDLSRWPDLAEAVAGIIAKWERGADA
ncbi:MAG: altronate oxidoreductase [Thermobacillus sp. ZCTH02-B1]|uniref:tagaturonate reductase n=1 Tax=Thermobacillus sp. ZCTH02-B1 TaxID=1858795 RepID=UPI000B584549|nr:tagaturonate reductase [Thermobacillus sp. ZCTH02-B1]OUM94564.1 MAG: altronate oxidoreductase [Thermobacillus sp. ZCTH02-B1]